jgi:hypothetical protein
MQQTVNPYAQLGNKLQQLAWVSVPIRGIGQFLYYLVTFRFLVTFADWLRLIAASVAESVVRLLLAAGKSAESLFIVATCYVIAVFVAHSFMHDLMGDSIMGTGNQLALLIFSALPELIIWDAVATSVERCSKATQSKRLVDWMWAGVTVAPTLVFAIMTIVTICSFTSLESANQAITQVTGLALTTRVLAGWMYATVNGLYNRIGKRSTGATGQKNSPVQTPDFSQIVNDLRAEVGQKLAEIESNLPSVILAEMQQSLNTLRTEIEKKIPTVEPLDYVAIAAQMTPVFQQFTASIQEEISAQIPAPVDLGQLALQVATQLQNSEQSSNEESTLDSEQIEDQGEQSDSEQLPNTGRLHLVNKPVRTQRTTENSEAAKKIKRLLRKDRTLGPTELASKCGCSKSYASTVKRTFLREQPA